MDLLPVILLSHIIGLQRNSILEAKRSLAAVKLIPFYQKEVRNVGHKAWNWAEGVSSFSLAVMIIFMRGVSAHVTHKGVNGRAIEGS